MQHFNIKHMKKHTLGFTWNSKVVTAIKLKMKLFHSLFLQAFWGYIISLHPINPLLKYDSKYPSCVEEGL